MQATHPYARARLIPPLRPGTFAGLMEIYERNYILLKQLFADHDPGVAYAVDCLDKRHRLESTLLERGRYTTTVLLAYSLLDHRRRPLARPAQLKVRIYHDAHQAELFRPAKHLCRDAAAICSPDGGAGGEKTIAVRWTLNQFLGNMLTLFNRRGVRLTRRESPRGNIIG